MVFNDEDEEGKATSNPHTPPTVTSKFQKNSYENENKTSSTNTVDSTACLITASNVHISNVYIYNFASDMGGESPSFSPPLLKVPKYQSPVASSGPICRICHEGDGKEDLVSPCQCTGTVGLVHKSCMERWLSTRRGANGKCEICHYNIATVRSPKSSLEEIVSKDEDEDEEGKATSNPNTPPTATSKSKNHSYKNENKTSSTTTLDSTACLITSSNVHISNVYIYNFKPDMGGESPSFSPPTCKVPKHQSPAASSGPICRICLEGDGKEDLVSPCRCTGTVGLVHKSCTERWLSTRRGANGKCEICHYKFATVSSPKSVVEHCANCDREASFGCADCKKVSYCSAFCQRKDWQSHRQDCGELILPANCSEHPDNDEPLY